MTWCAKCKGSGALFMNGEYESACGVRTRGAYICPRCLGSGYDQEKIDNQVASQRADYLIKNPKPPVVVEEKTVGDKPKKIALPEWAD